MTILEYDGPTAWADMSAVQKMQAILRGEATGDECAIYRQAIREDESAEACQRALAEENLDLRAEVARLRAALVEIGGFRMDQFAGASHMALACVDAAWRASLTDAERAALEPAR